MQNQKLEELSALITLMLVNMARTRGNNFTFIDGNVLMCMTDEVEDGGTSTLIGKDVDSAGSLGY